MQNARINAITTAAAQLIANRSGIKQAQEQGKGFTVILQHAYLDALKAEDSEAIQFVDGKVWKRGEEKGEYYDIRGVFSKVRAIHAAGIPVAADESFDKAYTAALKQRKDNPDPKEVESTALKAFAEENGMTLRDVRSMTLAEQGKALEQGIAILKAKASNTIKISDEELLSGLIALIDADRHAAYAVLEQALAHYDAVNTAAEQSEQSQQAA